jgi:enoyl-CoA hydratase
MVVRLHEAWKELRDDAELRVGVITGAGDAFSVGADLGRLIPLLSKARPPEDVWDRAMVADRSIFQTAFLRRFELWKPIVAAVNGAALAGGMELLQATDVRLAAPEAVFGLSEPKRGIMPGGGSTVRLARQIPYAAAMRILLTGSPISAQDALAAGFLNALVPREQLLGEALAVAAEIAANAPLAVQKIKESVVRGSGLALADAFALEDELVRTVMRSDDAREGPRAFLEKRAPNFKGR